MSARFFLRFTSDDGNEVEWVRQAGLDEEHQLAHSRGTLADAVKEAAGSRVIVLLPAHDVLFMTVRVPSRQRQHIISAVPYALEDQLAGDIDSLHFAIGERNDDGDVHVAVVNAEYIARIIESLRQAGLEAQVIIPDVLALPYQDNAWSILYCPDRIVVRSGRQQGFSVETQNTGEILERMLASEDGPVALQVYNCSGVLPDLGVKPGMEIAEVPVSESPLLFLARHYTETGQLNLVQGRFSRREQLGKLFRPWRAAAVLLAVVLVLRGAMTITDYFVTSSQNRRLAADIEQVFRDTFPGQKVEDARAQMAINLKMLKSGNHGSRGFMPILAIAGPVLREARGAELQHLAYRDGKLDVALTIRDLQLLEKLKQDLSALAGISVEIGTAASRDNVVEARLTIQQVGL